MNAPLDADNLDLMKFGVGQPVPRQEDPTLLKGQGRYTDDINLPGQAYAVMVRSQVAHGLLKGIDAEAARAMPGVLGIWTGADLNAAGYGALKTVMMVPNRDGSQMKTPTRYSLAERQGAFSSAIRWPSSSPKPRRCRRATRPKPSCSISKRCPR
jgi:carbon-monoxide dehydrogenase large subunit